jgi:chondroitin-sulfate-ABC endolyase/exolyase
MRTSFSKLLIVLLVLFLTLSVKAQDFFHDKIISFESFNENKWESTPGNTIEVSEAHFRHGEKSLRWKWNRAGAITLHEEIGYRKYDVEDEGYVLSSFVVWVFNEKPVDDHLRFVFSTDSTTNAWFSFGLNYSGWRAAWVSFDRDMQGEPGTKMNRLRIESPESVSSGSIYLDHMVLSIPIDNRHHTPDRQVPFVNKNTTNHWLILDKMSRISLRCSGNEVVTPAEKRSIRTIERHFEDDLLNTGKVSGKMMSRLRKGFDFYNIKVEGPHVTGMPLWFVRHAELYIPLEGRSVTSHFRKNRNDLKRYFGLMLNIAQSFRKSDDVEQRRELQRMFIHMYAHLRDQGVAFGSGMGTIHHYGYSWRDYYDALFLMKSALKEEGLLDDAIRDMQWYAIVNEVNVVPSEPGMDMDAFNTQALGRLASILIMEDSPAKVCYLKNYSRWIENGLLPAPGLKDSFKADGSVYHHANHYPAYAIGGLNGAVRVVRFLSGTPFQVSYEAHETLKNALLAMRFYCNLQQWPSAMSGRHPRGTESLVPEQYAILALAGSPDGEKTIDEELAAAYLRLTQYEQATEYHKLFADADIKPEQDPSGFKVMPYAASAIHRRDHWAVSVRGHSRYLWAAEHYLGANLYGRYLAHGQLQIMGNGEPVTNRASGYVQKGWDWNRFPGTTVVNLPVDQLKADVRNVDQYSGYEEMLFSDEVFAGGVHANNRNGVFAFILHEHDKYQGSLRARKSWFFFDDKIVCLGSGIENENSDRPTETVLFQNYQTSQDPPVFVNDVALDLQTKDTLLHKGSYFIVDNKNNGYYVPEDQVFLKQGRQYSRDQRSGEQTNGQFAAGVITHGTAPLEESYHYCVYPQINNKKFKKDIDPADYEILKQTAKSHVVYNKPTDQTGYVFFEAASDNNAGLIEATNIPCLAITQPADGYFNLHLSNPDLALYEGEADEVYENGKRVERSIYSRPWKYNDSKEMILEVTLRGLWKPLYDDHNRTKLLDWEHISEKKTVFRILSHQGKSYHLKIHSIDNK